MAEFKANLINVMVLIVMSVLFGRRNHARHNRFQRRLPFSYYCVLLV